MKKKYLEGLLINCEIQHYNAENLDEFSEGFFNEENGYAFLQEFSSTGEDDEVLEELLGEKDEYEFLAELPDDEREKWHGILKELDHEWEKNERRQKEHRDGRDLDWLAITPVLGDERDVPFYEYFSKLSNHNRWLDYIFFCDWENIHELVEREDIANALKSLTDLQKEALSLRYVLELKTRDIAKLRGTTMRNERKHLLRGLNNVRICLPEFAGEALPAKLDEDK